MRRAGSCAVSDGSLSGRACEIVAGLDPLNEVRALYGDRGSPVLWVFGLFGDGRGARGFLVGGFHAWLGWFWTA